MEKKTKAKKQGNPLETIISKKISIDKKKKINIMKLFGTLKFKKTSQEMKDEGRKGWG